MIRVSDRSWHEMRRSSLQSLSAMLGKVVLIATLSACSQGDGPGKPVARVNGKPISAYQLGDELGRAAEAGQSGAGRDATMQELIDRELLQAEAIRDRIDRDPHVAAALANARAQILAEAYLRSRVAYARAPSTEEKRAFFDKYPDKFAQRKLFHVKEIVLPPVQVTDELKAAVDSAKTLDDLAAWLDGRRIAHSQSARVYSSADITDTLRTKLQQMQPGQLSIAKDASGARLISIVDIQDSPLSFEAASAEIESILITQRARELGETALARLRAGAQVEYADRTETRTAALPKTGNATVPENFVKVSGNSRDTAQ